MRLHEHQRAVGPIKLKFKGALLLHVGARNEHVTETFKTKKVELRSQVSRSAASPSVVPDPLYWLNTTTGAYETLTPAVYDGIVAGSVRL